jgi:hypothetical protein
MEEEELLVESWLILKEYIKEKQQAADHWVGILIDAGVDDEIMVTLAAGDNFLKTAVEYNGGLDEEMEFGDEDY